MQEQYPVSVTEVKLLSCADIVHPNQIASNNCDSVAHGVQQLYLLTLWLLLLFKF